MMTPLTLTLAVPSEIASLGLASVHAVSALGPVEILAALASLAVGISGLVLVRAIGQTSTRGDVEPAIPGGVSHPKAA